MSRSELKKTILKNEGCLEEGGEIAVLEELVNAIMLEINHFNKQKSILAEKDQNLIKSSCMNQEDLKKLKNSVFRSKYKCKNKNKKISKPKSFSCSDKENDSIHTQSFKTKHDIHEISSDSSSQGNSSESDIDCVDDGYNSPICLTSCTDEQFQKFDLKHRYSSLKISECILAKCKPIKFIKRKWGIKKKKLILM